MKRYGALRTIAIILKILAWVVLILGILGSLLIGFLSVDTINEEFELESGGEIIAIAYAVIGTLISALYFLFVLAAAQFIYLFLDIEQNTRETAELLKQGRST